MYPTKNNIAVSEADLLAQASVKAILRQLFDLSGLPQAYFQRLYTEPLGRFLALTQHSPLEKQSAHLMAVVKALKMRRALILPLGADAESISKQKDLWTYAVFVGSLLYNSAVLFSGKVVYKKKGETSMSEWSPYSGALPVGSPYRMVDTTSVHPLVISTLLPSIFCTLALGWLYREADVLNVALQLAVSPESVTRIGELVMNAHNQNADLSKSKVTQVPDSTDHKGDETPPGDGRDNEPDFRQWLKKAIDSGRYSDHIMATTDGHVIAEPDIFDAYCKETGASNPEKQRDLFFVQRLHKGGHRIRFGSGATKRAFLISGDVVL